MAEIRQCVAHGVENCQERHLPSTRSGSIDPPVRRKEWNGRGYRPRTDNPVFDFVHWEQEFDFDDKVWLEIALWLSK